MVPDLHIGDHLRGAVAGVDSQQRSRTPSAIAAGCIIRASCPPPTTPTTGNPRDPVDVTSSQSSSLAMRIR